MKDIKIVRFFPLKDGWLRIECESNHDEFETDLELIDHKVNQVHKVEQIQTVLTNGEVPTKSAPKISPKTDSEIIDELEKAGLDASIVDISDYGPLTWIKLSKYLQDKELWTKYNNIFKDAGFKWIAARKITLTDRLSVQMVILIPGMRVHVMHTLIPADRAAQVPLLNSPRHPSCVW